ncbi:MAG: amino acid ABC transporter substrate-binding protein [Pseudomonadota bacterium]
MRARGHLECGVSDGVAGFSTVDERGRWSGLDVDLCRALAVAVLGDRSAVKLRPLPVADRFRALEAGEVDVLARNTTWTLSRDSERGVRFVDVLFYDGQGFLAPRTHALASALELTGAKVCVLAGAGAEAALAGFFNARRMRYQLVASAHWDELVRLYESGGCTVLSADISALASARSRLSLPSDHVLLPEMVSKEPLGPWVRASDSQWFAIVRWTLKVLIAAEELGISSTSVEAMQAAGSEAVARLLGGGAGLGLAPDWALQIVRQVGSYGELYERSLGQGSPLKLKRGLNDLWTRGGLMYAPPIR